MNQKKAKMLRKQAIKKVKPWSKYTEITYHQAGINEKTKEPIYFVDPITMDYCGRKLYKTIKKAIKNRERILIE